MKAMLLAVLMIFGMVCPALANDAIISERLKGYWQAYSSTNFARAAEFMHPDDLNEMKRELLPVFLRASNSEDLEVRQLAMYFFSEASQGDYSKMTQSEVFVGLNMLIAGLSPDMFSLLKDSELEVVNSYMTSDGAVALNVAIKLAEGSVEEVMYFGQKNDEWFMRVSEEPSVTANGFRQLFGQ